MIESAIARAPPAKPHAEALPQRLAARREGSAPVRRASTGGAEGAAEIGFARRGGRTGLAHLYQHDPLRVLFPAAERGDAALAVLVTTSGGLVAGDRLRIEVRAEVGAVAHITASAAEKIYRSTGATAEIVQNLSIGEAARLEYLPPETILFDGARLRRRTTVALAGDAGWLGGGLLVFGRRARGESFTRGLLNDRLEIRRGGALVWGDALHLDGDIGTLVADPACFAGAAACATLVLAPPGGDPGPFVASGRAVQQPAAGLRAAITAVNGVAVARWLAADVSALRRAFAALACHWRAAAFGLPPLLPRLWHV